MLKTLFIKLLAIFLLLSQFVMLAHAFEHDLSHDENEQCVVCLKQHQFDDAIIPILSTNNSHLYHSEKIVGQEYSAYHNVFSQSRSRSPPHFS